MIRAIAFDIGDTLLFYGDMPLDWSSRYEDALSLVGRACGVSPTASQVIAACEILMQYNTRVRPRTEEVAADEIFSLVLRAWNRETAEQVTLAVDTFFTFFQQRMCAFPETLSVLGRLRAAGARLGALTDVPYGMPHKFVERDLDQADISQFMDVVVTSAMVGVRKPEVAGYYALATSLAVEPDEMLYVGNEPKDVIGAKRSGVLSAFLDRNGAGGSHGQSFTISSLSAIHDIMCAAD